MSVRAFRDDEDQAAADAMLSRLNPFSTVSVLGKIVGMFARHAANSAGPPTDEARKAFLEAMEHLSEALSMQSDRRIVPEAAAAIVQCVFAVVAGALQTSNPPTPDPKTTKQDKQP